MYDAVNLLASRRTYRTLIFALEAKRHTLVYAVDATMKMKQEKQNTHNPTSKKKGGGGGNSDTYHSRTYLAIQPGRESKTNHTIHRAAG